MTIQPDTLALAVTLAERLPVTDLAVVLDALGRAGYRVSLCNYTAIGGAWTAAVQAPTGGRWHYEHGIAPADSVIAAALSATEEAHGG